MGVRRLLFAAWLLVAAWTTHALAADLEPLVEALHAVGPKGAGNRQAAQAWEQLARADAAQLPAILRALDDAGPLAANWIRCAVDAIAERELGGGGNRHACFMGVVVCRGCRGMVRAVSGRKGWNACGGGSQQDWY